MTNNLSCTNTTSGHNDMIPQLQYACVAWDPDQIKYISNLENG